MSEPFIGQIRMFAGTFAPRGWAFCNGQLLQIAQNTALFALIGTTYGGDGRTTFALPNLQGAAPLHPGQGPGLTRRRLGEDGGQANVTLTEAEMPAHTHDAKAHDAPGNQNSPAGHLWAVGRAQRTTVEQYAGGGSGGGALGATALATAGNSQPHNNLPPYLGLNFCIALVGIFPSRN